MRLLKKYLPSLYRENKEMEGLMNAEQPIYDEAETDTKFAFSRQFVVTADEKGVEQYEKILGIMPTATDSLEFRKRRVITFNNSAIYTELFKTAAYNDIWSW